MAVGERVAEEAPDELLSFAPLEDGNGLEIVDHIERRHCTVHTREPISVNSGSADGFPFPVDKAIEIETDHLSISQRSVVGIRNSLGFMLDELSKGDSRTYPADKYSVELSIHMKLYIEFSGPFSITVADRAVIIDFGATTQLKMGIRSHHKHPAGTITTTQDIDGLMWAASLFGSALKTLSCERSYPTLRGHPPLVEFGNQREIDPKLRPPETGVIVQLPPEPRFVFSASPLAFYLGARVEVGTDPCLCTERGYRYSLDGPHGFNQEVERALKQIFFFDCITRTEGLFQVELRERRILEESVDLDLAELYEQPLSKQIEEYLKFPFSKVRNHLPQWKLTAKVDPRWSHFRALPFLLNDLAIIDTPEIRDSSRVEEPKFNVEGFFRNHSSVSVVPSAESPRLIRIEDSDSMEQTWIGDGAPIEASKGMIEAFRNRLDRVPADGDIDITVVCNDGQMIGERDIVNDIYGSREKLPFDVSVHKDITTESLRKILNSDIDFFHYIGHIDGEGFECTDGRLDATSLDGTGVNAFFLNACTSYYQGMHLIEAGAIAGVVTLQDVINSGAERIGKTLAQLLNNGYPLRAALNVAKTQSIMGGHYLVIGDGSFDIAQPEGGFPALCNVKRWDEGWSLTYSSFLTRERAIGSIITPFIKENEFYYIASGEVDQFILDDGELRQFLSAEDMPVLYENELMWSDEMLGLIPTVD